MSLQTRLADLITAIGADMKLALTTTPFKQRVRAVAVSNITLSGTQTIDGVAVVAGNRVLVAGQTSQPANGVYIVASGSWTRDTDFDNAAKAANAVVAVSEGALYSSTLWSFPITPVQTLGTSSVVPLQIPNKGFGTTAGTVAQGNDSRIVGAMQKANNLSDVANAAIALSNLGAAAASQISPVYVTMTMQGTQVVRTGTVRWPVIDFTYDLLSVRGIVSTAPTGAALKFDVKKNGTSIFNSQPTIAVSTNSVSSNNFSSLTVGDGDYLTVDVTQIGSTVPGSDLVVVLEMFRH